MGTEALNNKIHTYEIRSQQSCFFSSPQLTHIIGILTKERRPDRPIKFIPAQIPPPERQKNTILYSKRRMEIQNASEDATSINHVPSSFVVPVS